MNFVTFSLSGIVGLGFGLFLNDKAVHYDDVSRFFAGPIYGATGFIAALYARSQAGEDWRRIPLFLLLYMVASGVGFMMTLGIPSFFHRLSMNASIGLDVFVRPLLIFGLAIFAVRGLRGYVRRRG